MPPTMAWSRVAAQASVMTPWLSAVTLSAAVAAANGPPAHKTRCLSDLRTQSCPLDRF